MHFAFALYLSLVVQFSMTVRRLFRDSFVIIPHLLSFVNTFFKTFLSFFRGFFKRRLRYILPRLEVWWAIRDSNPGPTGYEPVALTN